MISLDQVVILEEKVESAVAKIQQLNAENAALRSKCLELSNALNAKTELLSTFQNDQGKIEEGILKALNRLNAVENVILSAEAASSPLQENHQSSETVEKESSSQTQDSITSKDSAPSQEILGQPSKEEPQSSSLQEVQPSSYQSGLQNQESAYTQNQQNGASIQSENQLPQNPSSEERDSQGIEPSLTPDVDFEFGEADANPQTVKENVQNQSSPSDADSSQPMFDIF